LQSSDGYGLVDEFAGLPGLRGSYQWHPDLPSNSTSVDALAA